MVKIEAHLLFQLLELQLNSKLKQRITLVIILFAIIFTACENLNEPGEPKYKHSILFKLNSGISKQRFYIYNVAPLAENSYGYLKQYDKYFDPGAQISIESDGIEVVDFYVESDSQNIRYYTSDSFNVLPGKEYHLSINVGNELISGTTNVPETFSIISPVENQVIRYNNNELKVNYKWTKSINSYGYQIQISYAYIFGGIIYENNFPFSDNISDTLYIYKTYLEPVDTVYSIISAYDKNYFDHIYRGKESAGIEGAYGYFGSTVYLQNRFIVR